MNQILSWLAGGDLRADRPVVQLLTNADMPFPEGWVKSEHLEELTSGRKSE